MRPESPLDLGEIDHPRLWTGGVVTQEASKDVMVGKALAGQLLDHIRVGEGVGR